jgi:hypothetical protein
MKCFLYFLLLIIAAQKNECFMKEVVNITKYLDLLNQFCEGENKVHCTKELMNFAMSYVKGIQNKINQEIFEEIQKVKRVERAKKRKNQRIKQMLREHFLDRHF